jgi:hypothetical protein
MGIEIIAGQKIYSEVLITKKPDNGQQALPVNTGDFLEIRGSENFM